MKDEVPNINNAHDKFFKAVFSRREEALSFLRGALPPEILKKIKPETIKPANSSYISKELQESMSDIVYEGEFEDFPVKIAFIIEHKSYIPDFPFLQFLLYFVNCINAQIKQTPKDKPLQLALPIIIVLYHGKKQWEIKPIWKYFGDVPPELIPYFPSIEYLLVNLEKDTYKEIKERFDSLILRISLMTMKGTFDSEGYQKSLEFVFEGVTQLFTNEQAHNFFETLLIYIFDRLDIDNEKLFEIINEQTQKGGEKVMTIAARLRQEGRQEGIEEGWEKGILRGRAEGMEKGMEKGILRGRVEGIEQGKKYKAVKTAIKLLQLNMDTLNIKEITELSDRDIKLVKAYYKQFGVDAINHLRFTGTELGVL